MMLYRVRYYTDHGSSNGFSWHSSMADAKKHGRDYKFMNPDEEEPFKIEPVYIESGKRGLLKALNHYAGEPQNG